MEAQDRARRGRFFWWAAIACAAIAIGGFMPTYWLQLAPKTFIGPPVLHIHAAFATAWILFLVIQARLVMTGRIRSHRDWGLAGIALATAVTFLGITVAILGLRHELELGFGDASRSFLVVPLTAILGFAGLTAAAIANVKRPQWHKRLMIAGTVSLIEAAAARVGFIMATGGGPGARPGLFPPPPAMPVIITGLLCQLILVAGMIYDRRTSGRIHPAWWVGLGVNLLIIFVRQPLGATPGWLAFAQWTTHIGG